MTSGQSIESSSQFAAKQNVINNNGGVGVVSEFKPTVGKKASKISFNEEHLGTFEDEIKVEEDNEDVLKDDDIRKIARL